MNLPNYINKDFAKFFGFMLGDGFITTGNRIGFALGNKEFINEKYLNLFSNFYFNLKVNNKNGKPNSIFASSKELKNIFIKMGFIPGAHNKRIPSWVFESKKEIQEAFFEGLMDADGYERCQKNIMSYEISLCNKELIEDLKELCNRIGWVSGKIRERKRFGGHVIEGNRKIKDTVCYELYVTKEILPEIENILSIEEIGEDFVYDIEVEHQTHNFIANGIPVHNSRAPERRVFYIDVGNLSRVEAKRFLEKVKNSYRTQSFIDENGNLNKRARMLSITNDIFVPVREGSQGTRIETLQGGEALHNIDDMKYFRDKILKTMNIPAAYLGDETDRSRGSLSQLDIKFSRFIERVQSQIIKGLNKIAALELFFAGYKKEDLNSFEIELTPPSNIKEITEIELMMQKISLLSNIQTLGIFSNKWMLKNVLKMSDAEIADIELYKSIEGQAQPGEEGIPGGAGMPIPGEAGVPGETETIPGEEVPGATPEAGIPAETGTEAAELAASTMINLLGREFIVENKNDFFKIVKLVKEQKNKNNNVNIDLTQITEKLSEIFYKDKDKKPETNNVKRLFIINELGGIHFNSGKSRSINIWEEVTTLKDNEKVKSFKEKTISLID